MANKPASATLGSAPAGGLFPGRRVVTVGRAGSDVVWGDTAALEAAVEVAVYGTASCIDLGRIHGRAFALVAGAGFDAAVMHAATRELKERWGFGAYIYAAMKEALTAGPRRSSVGLAWT